MISGDKRRGSPVRPAARFREGLACAGSLLLAALCILVSGCTSMFHRAQPKLPPRPRDQLVMRVNEALQADICASQSGKVLRDHVRKGVPAETLQTDLDRLEMSAFELERRALAARDIDAICDQKTRQTEQIDSLQRRSKIWLDFIEAARRTGSANQMARLDELLRENDLSH